MEKLPETLQLLGPDKVREPDPAIRLILVETLVLLATTRACREAMRTRGVYFVIKAAHLAETVMKVRLLSLSLLNLRADHFSAGHGAHGPSRRPSHARGG